MLNFKNVNSLAIILLISLIVAYIFLGISLWWFVLLGFLWFTITALGSGLIGWNYHLKALNSNSLISENQVAITFDDGPNPEFTPRVLELLKSYQAKATFFCIGLNTENYPKLINNIINEGHTIGNHTYSHHNMFGFFSTQQVIDELKQTNDLVLEKTGLKLKLYRPAFGVTNPRIKKALEITKLQAIGWNKRSLDTTSLNKEHVLKRASKNLKKGDVILLHDSSEKSLWVLEQLLLILQKKDLQAVTIDKLFNIEPYA
ncbi:polysaccharide deacetylase family protein [Xanthomarina sp. F2636L]|uniref:polysaccharide deacetylase family protein n=1 Tax=Xanthomarina sp. F2636L TaxID=2996018 RepID=UPI00225DD8D0|nr:polysaccharide deacetylase family protein [Xanthomarina sp. F2636L]MCX7551456.1 polysaccharide deacetylase family protein [Xanthomarina sp. F2636L]